MIRLAGASYLATALALVTGPLVARALGADGRGELAAAGVYSGILTLVAGFGLPTAVGHAVATRARPAGEVLATTVRFVCWLILPMVGLAVLLVDGPLSGLSDGGRLGAAVLLATVPLGVLTNCLSSMLVGEGALGPLASLRILPLLITAAVTVVLYGFGALSIGVLLSIMVLVTIGTAAASLWLVRVRPTRPAPFFELLAFGLRGYGGNLAVFATHMVDQAFILPILGVRPLGFYALAVSISAIPNSIALAVYSRYFSLVAEETDGEARAALIGEGLRLTLYASAAVTIAVAGASPFFLPLLYGNEFRQSVTPLLVLLPGSVVFCLSMVGESFLTAVGLPGRVTLSELFGFVVTAVGLPVVLPRFGIVGAAALSTGSYVVVLCACLGFLRRFGTLSVRIRPGDVDRLRSFGASMLRSALELLDAVRGRKI